MSEHIIFMRGDVIQTHTILIEDDDECEIGTNEQFLSNIAVSSGIADIRVTVPQANITIEDSDEFECGRWMCCRAMCQYIRAEYRHVTKDRPKQ